MRATQAVQAITSSRLGHVARNLVPATVRRHVLEKVNVPSMGDSITDGALNQWKKAVGEEVELDELIALIDTDKVSVDVLSAFSGRIAGLMAKEGDSVNVGDPLYYIETDPDATLPDPATLEGVSEGDSPDSSSDSVPAEPKKQKFVAGGDDTRPIRREPIPRIRKTIANKLKTAQQEAAALTTYQEIDMTNAKELRAKLMKDFQKEHGQKLGFMGMFLRASDIALHEVPAINGFYDAENNMIEHRDFTDISMAVATPTGLAVPVLRDCHTRDVAAMEKELARVADKCRSGTITTDEMNGGTFSISNGGVFGSLFGGPIINYPQSAILGLHNMVMRPVVVADGSIQARPMMYVALTYDHRMVDGREAVTFLKRIKECMENPEQLFAWKPTAQ